MNFLNNVKKTLAHHSLIKKGDRVLVGVSGGPDSMAMICALAKLRYDMGFHLYVAHFNHRLRKSAILDEHFVKKIANRFQIPFIAGHAKVTLFKKAASEEYARQARFDFFIKAAKQCRAQSVALGHTQNDLAETVLMRLIRGTGLSGLRAILPCRKIHGVTFIRPLIERTRTEVLQFLKQEKMTFRIDPTNNNMKFFRNRLRKELLPSLSRHYNPNITTILSQMAFIVGDDYDFIEDFAMTSLKKARTKGAGHGQIRLQLNPLNKMHPSLQRAVIRKTIEELQGDTRRLTFTHIMNIEELLTRLPCGARLNLPEGLVVNKTARFLVFSNT